MTRAKPAGHRPVIWLHIGINKTGTTALQNLFAAKRETLLAHGVLYPEAATHANAHHPLAWQCGFHQGPPPPAETSAEDLARAIREESRAHPGAAVLLSSEFLSLRGDIRQLKQLLKPADFRVIVYLRRHDSWLQSVYAQAVKTVINPKWGRGIQSFLKTVAHRHGIGDYRAMLDEWASFVGPEHMVVRPFERAQVAAGLHRDLLTAIGFPSAANAMPADLPRENESLSYEAVSLIDIVAHTRLPDSAKCVIRDAVLRHDPGTQRSVSYLSPAERRALIDARAEDYAYIARTWLGREDGRLFEEPLPDPDDAWKAPAHPTAMWVTERVVGYLAQAEAPVALELRGAAGRLLEPPVRR